MIDLSKYCIFSGNSDNLHTTMVVSVDGEDYKISISDEYEDEASLGAIKKLIRKKSADQRNKHEELLKLAKELGYNLTPGVQTQSNFSDQQKTSEKPQEPHNPGELKTLKNRRENKPKMEGLSEKEAEAALDRVAKRSEIDSQQEYESPPPGTASRIPSLRIPKTIGVKVNTPEGQRIVDIPAPEPVSQQSQIVEGRGGVPVKIPRASSSRVGDTNITISKFDDRDLQNVTKNYAATGHQYADCRYCNGSGVNRVSKKECPKCEGKGIIY